MPAVTFDNTQNVGFIVANTAAPRRNLDISVPPGPAGDTLVVVAAGNTGTAGMSMNVAGFTSWFTTTSSPPSPGEMLIAFKTSNGRENVVSVKTDGSTDVNFCAAVLRVKSTHRIYPLMGPVGSGSSSNTAADGVQLSTGATPTSKPIGDGTMLISFIVGSDGNSFLDGEQPAGQTLITKANTANARMMVSYEMKPLAGSYGDKVFANTAGRRRALTFSVCPDTMVAGVKETGWGGGVSSNKTGGHGLQYDPRVSFLAREDEEIGEVGVRIGSISGDGAGIEIGVYDVTNGYANAKLAGAQTVNTLLASSSGTYIQTFYPPIKLIPGRRYSTGFRTISATNITINTSYLGNGIGRTSSQNGAVALPSSWDYDNGSLLLDNWYNMFASVRNNRKVHVSSYKYFTNTVSGTAHSSSFPLYPGGSKKIIAMAYAELQTATMNVATFDGEPMTLIANQTDQEDFCMWYYDIPESGQIQDFTRYTEFDPLNDLTLTGTNQINIDTMAAANPGETGYRLDLGVAGKPGDFRYRIGPINVSAASADPARFSIFSFTETVSAQFGSEPKSLHVRWTRTLSESNSTLQLAHFDAAGAQTTNPTASASYTGPEVFLNTDFYVDISRAGSSAFCSIYTDSEYKSLVTTLSIPLTDSIAYRYLYFASVWSTGTSSTVTATIKNAYNMVGDAGNKLLTVTTPQSTSIISWHAWQLNRANTGMPRNSITYSGQGVSSVVSNTIITTENSMILATIASSSPARTYSWNADVVTDRQELGETNQKTATADGFQTTASEKTVTATASGTEGTKNLGIVCIDTIKSKNKIKSGFVG